MLSPSLSKQSEKPLKTASHLPAALTACTRYAAGRRGHRSAARRSRLAAPLPTPCSERLRPIERSLSTRAQPRGAPLLKVNERLAPEWLACTQLRVPADCLCLGQAGRVSEFILVPQLPPETISFAVSTAPFSHFPFLLYFPFSTLPAPFISQHIPSKPGRGLLQCNLLFSEVTEGVSIAEWG